MKKLFTLVALLAFFLGAKAETVVDYECDYTTAASWSHGWVNDALLAHLVLEDGALHFSNDEVQPNFYDYQGQIHPGIQVDNDALYTITLRIKGTVAQDIHASFSGSSTPGMIPITTEWVDVVLENCVNDPNAAYFASSGSLLIQPGDYVGEFWIASIKITHEEKGSSRPVVWLQQLTDDGTPEGKYMGDAEFGQWPDWALEKNDEGVNINWRGDRTGEICAWSIVRGKNIDPSQEPDPVKDPDGNVIPEGKPRPFPCDIEVDPTDPTNHVFVVHSAVADNQFTDWQAWDNQFFIQSPKAWKSGTKIKFHFKYKAEKPAKAQTQIHRQNPSWYLHYVGIGDVNFTTEWQEFDNTITFSDAQGGGWSVAFNLNAENKEANTFYFDDLSWEVMQLDEGFFVASSNSTTGIEYDYDNATEFIYDAAEEAYVATVGTVGKKDTWVNEVMISTVRGETAAFKGATIKPAAVSSGDDVDDWKDYAAGSQAKIKLPAAGVWKIFIAPVDPDEVAADPTLEGTGQILFMKLEGEEAKEPVDIITVTGPFVINATERDWLPANDDGTPKEEEIGTGAAWDNQFWIAADRDLQLGEETIIEFDYVANKVAKTSTQDHKIGDDGKPCTYLYWDAIGDVNFTTETQHFSKEFKPSKSDWGSAEGMRSIVFNMSEIKEACDYTISNVRWYLKSDVEGKTLENLIKDNGNFWIKINKSNPYLYGTDPSGIFNISNTITTDSDVIYNLSGQRVSKDYKGVVIKNGRKVVVK